MKDAWKSLGVLCVLLIGIFAYTTPLGRLESSTSKPADAYYNLLVQGFRDGHLSLKKEVPPGFAQLADPYDPAANRPYKDFAYKMGDMSYYKGRLYIYFGVTPALILFWPFTTLTGHYLFERHAVTIFCAIGILASVGLLRALWRRYFAEVSVGVVVVCAMALGLASGLLTVLPRSKAHETATSCGYMLTMLALVAIWCALHQPERRCRWLAASSVAYGLALGARPSLLFGAVILLVPVAYAWRQRQQCWAALLAATVPITLIGLGLMLYNDLRFDSPFEFGFRYLLTVVRVSTRQIFSLRNLWFNFRVYFLEPARWSGRIPFVHDIALPPLPVDYCGVDDPFGILTNIPLVWAALAVPLAWRNRSEQARSILRWFATAVALLFVVCASVLCLFSAASIRYAVDFLPALMLLAVVGILGLERALADRPPWRRAARWGWGVLLVFSVAFNVLVSAVRYAQTGCALATVLVIEGRVPEAIQVFEKALRIVPDFADGHYNLGIALWQAGRRQEAIREYECALRLNPDYANVHLNLGTALAQMGKLEEAMQHYEEAVRIEPNNPAAHLNVGAALYQMGRVQNAIKEFELALQIWPDDAEAHNNLGGALLHTGDVQNAIAHYEQALRIKPDYAEAHYNLGMALVQLGRLQEAMGHWEQALRLKPDYAAAHYNLGLALAQAGNMPEAMKHWEEALRIKPDDVEAHFNLGLALEKMGRTTEAIEQYELAVKLRPEFLPATKALARLQASQ